MKKKSYQTPDVLKSLLVIKFFLNFITRYSVSELPLPIDTTMKINYPGQNLSNSSLCYNTLLFCDISVYLDGNWTWRQRNINSLWVCLANQTLEVKGLDFYHYQKETEYSKLVHIFYVTYHGLCILVFTIDNRYYVCK